MVPSVATEKIPGVTPPGIDPETVRLVAQCLNHYAIPGPRKKGPYKNNTRASNMHFFRKCRLVSMQSKKSEGISRNPYAMHTFPDVCETCNITIRWGMTSVW
jgi:hypothetical protein